MPHDTVRTSVDWLARLRSLRGETAETAEIPPYGTVSAVLTVGGGGERAQSELPAPCTIAGCTTPIAEGDLAFCAEHRAQADDGALLLRCVLCSQSVAPNDRIACAECRARIDATVLPWDRPPSKHAPAAWRCFACRSSRRSHRPAWDDWTCDQCRVIVPGPEETERPWRLVRRVSPSPVSGPAPRVVWGRERGYIAVYDSATDTWHEIAYQDAPAVWRAAIRKHRRGDDEHPTGATRKV